jgi:hypothetical protein
MRKALIKKNHDNDVSPPPFPHLWIPAVVYPDLIGAGMTTAEIEIATSSRQVGTPRNDNFLLTLPCLFL